MEEESTRLLVALDRIAQQCNYPVDSALRTIRQILLDFKKRLDDHQGWIEAHENNEGYGLEDLGIKQPVGEAITRAIRSHEQQRH